MSSDAEPEPDLVVQPSYPWLHRLVCLIASTAGAVAAVAVACVHGLPAHAVVVMFVMAYATGFGVTLGFHRLFAHRSFAASRPVEWALLALGCAAGQSSPFFWIATHRRHHRHSDAAGDPHSPRTADGRRLGRWRGFWHAHLGWLCSGDFGYPPGAIRDLIRRADLVWFDRHWLLWYVAGLLAPAAAGYAIGGTGYDALVGFLWGGLLRHFLTIQATLLVNSVNHLWGTRPHATADGSRNNLLTGILAFGEGWHNNHHAFPWSARHGIGWRQPDLSWWVLWGMERAGLVWRVKRMPRILLALFTVLFAGPAGAADWPTLGGSNPRHAFYPAFPAGKLRLVWRHELHKELTGPRAEVIVAGGRAFLGTYAGTVYAWDAGTGNQLWAFQTGGPVWHSPAYRDGTLFVGSADRFLYALDAADGSVKWKYAADEGVTVAPAVAGGLVLFGDRGGTFHAVRAKNGKRAFAVETGGPVLTPAAVTADGSACVFASEDMRAYCVELPSGKPRWKSRKMAGVTCRDYPPVVAHGLAFLGTAPIRDFHHGTLDADDKFLVGRTGFAGKDRRYVPGTPADVEKEQDAIVKRLTDDPSRQTFYAFRLDDGKEPWVAPILYTGGLHNPPTPPCVNPDTGEVFVVLRSAYSVWDGGGEVRSLGAVGRLDPKTGRVKLVEHSYRPKGASRPPGSPDIPYASFPLIGDETQSLSCSPGRLFSNHQGTLGELDLRAGACRVVWGRRDTYGGFYGPGTFGWENQGGEAKAAKAGRPFALVNEWHGPARGVASVAGGRVYLNVGSQALCLEPEGEK